MPLLLRCREVSGESRSTAALGRSSSAARPIRFADHFGGHALADLALPLPSVMQRHVGVAVHVDEAGRHVAALGIDGARRGAGDAADAGDLAVLDRDRPLTGAPPVPSMICALVISVSNAGASACLSRTRRQERHARHEHATETRRNGEQLREMQLLLRSTGI